MPKVIVSKGATRQVETAVILSCAKEAIALTFGEKMACHMQPSSVKNGVLRISCTHSVYAEELNLRSDELIDILRQNFCVEVISQIRTN